MSQEILDSYFARMMAVLKDKTGEVEIDIESPHCSASYRAAAEMERERQKRIKSGERVAYLYTHEHDDKTGPRWRQWVLCTGVSRERAGELIDAGAKWIGGEHYRP